MSKERSPIMTSSSSICDKLDGTLNTTTSLTFMEIRYRSLGKALDELRTKRVQLEDDLRKGYVEESQYASTLLKLILETNTLNKERSDVEEKVKAIKTNKLR
ncbi:hypothetical protein EU527_08385 [Candidatus Thorarchaeota archaeon]|nr:MAG: hypothetical protein EU527_08385 [Candidatus Thorarchaeota archaeon]